MFKSRLPFLFIFTLSIFLSSNTLAQQDVIRNITDHEHIISLARDGSTLWAGSHGGLTQIMLSDNKPVSYTNIGQFNGISVFTILVDGDYTWFGTANGLYKWRNRIVAHYTNKNGLQDIVVTTLYKHPNGDLLVGTAKGLNILDGVNWKTNKTTRRVIDKVNEIQYEENGTGWYGTSRGIYKVTDQRVDQILIYHDIYDENVFSLDIDSYGSLWLLGVKGVNQYVTDHWWRRLMADQGFPQEIEGAFGMIRFDEAGNLWVVNDGVSMYDGSLWWHYDTTSGLASNKVSCMLIEENGDIWFGTSKGISKRTDSDWETYTFGGIENRAYTQRNILQIAQDNHSKLWLLTTTGLITYDNGVYEDIPASDLIDFSEVNIMIFDNNGTLLIGSDSGLFSLNGSEWNTWQSISNKVNMFSLESNGSILISTDKGLFRYSHEKITEVMPDLNVLEAREGTDGSIWLITKNSLLHISPDQTRNYIPNLGQEDVIFTSFMVRPGNTLRLGTENYSMVSFDSKTWRTFNSSNGFITRNIQKILSDKNNTTWLIPETGGLFKYEYGIFVNYSTNTGLATNEVNSVFFDDDNTKWIATDIGMIKLTQESFAIDDFSAGIIAQEQPIVTKAFKLHQNYPNPFNSGTTITVDCHVSLLSEISVYDLLGRRIKLLDRRVFTPGSYSYSWDGTNKTGQYVNSGFYIIRIRAGIYTESVKVLLLK